MIQRGTVFRITYILKGLTMDSLLSYYKVIAFISCTYLHILFLQLNDHFKTFPRFEYMPNEQLIKQFRIFSISFMHGCELISSLKLKIHIFAQKHFCYRKQICSQFRFASLFLISLHLPARITCMLVSTLFACISNAILFVAASYQCFITYHWSFPRSLSLSLPLERPLLYFPFYSFLHSPETEHKYE